MRFLNGMWQDERDTKPMGPPETIVDLPGDLTLGLYIPAPFGRHTDAVLAVRAVDDGTPGWRVTLAITTSIARATTPRMDVTLLSNPRRRIDADWWRENGS